jgi:uncharacterized protein YjiS (DUF1127 family)
MTTPTHRLSRLPAALVRGFVRRNRERAAQAALQRLSDFELRDIGLDRADIPRAVHYGHPARR